MRRRLRARMQMIFQDPYGSLDPRRPAGAQIADGLLIHGLADRGQARGRVKDLLQRVGLDPSHADRLPHEFSGGQRQRIAIARALATEPEFIVADEPVSALDVSVQAQILTLMADLSSSFGLALLFISHDLHVVRHLCERVVVMYLGRIVEEGPADQVYERPRHPYTQALLSAIPVPDPERQRDRRRIVLVGDIPSAAHAPSGCHFHTRCPYVMDVCREVDPEVFEADDGAKVFCHLHREGPALRGAAVTGLQRE
jgi:oligopeptide transport system ATP-binding protein